MYYYELSRPGRFALEGFLMVFVKRIRSEFDVVGHVSNLDTSESSLANFSI